MDRSQIGYFLSDPEFIRVAGSGLDDPEWQAYQLKHSNKKNVLLQARLIFLASRRFPTQMLDENRKKNIWNKIENDLESPSGNRRLGKHTWIRLAAASVMLVFGLAWLNNRSGLTRTEGTNTSMTVESEIDWREITNSNNGIFPVDLPDGSTVLLKKDSRVRYSSQKFQSVGRREVYLEGEAFFEVVPNAEAPFYVFANELVTKVLGTSFNIKAFADAPNVEVTVKTGRVTVFRSVDRVKTGKVEDPKGEILNPDQKITLDKNSGALVLGEISIPENHLEQSQFNFEDKPLSEVFSTIENYYQVRILYPEEKLKNCRITAAIPEETLYEKIRLICKGLNATYEVINGEIVISSEGCNY